MKILILGGTGAIGSHLVSILSMGGGNCFVTSRSKRENRQGVTYVCGNARDITFVQSLLKSEKWDAIVDFMKYSTDDFKSRHQLLLSSTKQYIYLSSSRVYADTQGKITEDSPRLLDVCKDQSYLKTDEYALFKARQEDILRQSSYGNWTIVRPYVTFSEQRLQLSALEKEFWLYRAIKGRTIVFSKDLAERTTTLTYGEDVARGIASLIGKENSLRKTFHIATSESHKWKDILDTYLDAIEKKTGRRPKVLLQDKWKPYHGGNNYQVTFDRLYDRQFDNSRINEYIDTKTFKPTLPALSECISQFLDNPVFKPINWKSEAKKDRQTGEWASMSEIQGVRQKMVYLMFRLGIIFSMRY